MNTLLLKYAVEVEKTGSISRAAENLYMNQPHLSKSIRELEDTVGISIFNRTSRGVIPTRKGSEFLVYAKNILRQLEEMESLYNPKDNQKSKFDICVPRAEYISLAFTNFLNELDFDSINIDYRETNSVRAIKNVSVGENNIGIIRYPMQYEKYFLQFLNEKDLKHNLIWKFCPVVITSKHCELSSIDIDREVLKNYIELTYGDTTIPLLALSEVKELKNKNIKKNEITIYERASKFEILSNVSNTYMISSPVSMDVLEKYSLIQRVCTFDDDFYKDALIYKNGYKLSSADKLFIQSLSKVISALKNLN